MRRFVEQQFNDEYARYIRDLYWNAEVKTAERLSLILDKKLSAYEYEGLERKLQELREVNNIINAELIKNRPTNKELERHIAENYDKGAAEAGKQLIESDMLNKEIKKHVRGAKIKALANEVVSGLSKAERSILRTTKDAYRKSTIRAVEELLTGSINAKQATKIAIDDLLSQNVSTFVDKAGKHWDIGSYCEMSIRTASQNAYIEGTADKYLASGHDLVIITAHGDCCSLCSPHEGQVYSLSGNSNKYPSLESARDDGIFHPNCRHSFNLFIEGVTEKPKVEPQGDFYLDRQKQRYYERQLRKIEKKERCYKATGQDTAKLAQSRKAYQQKLKAHIKDTNKRYEEETGVSYSYLRRDIDREKLARGAL